jgi:hypothetical protein
MLLPRTCQFKPGSTVWPLRCWIPIRGWRCWSTTPAGSGRTGTSPQSHRHRSVPATPHRTRAGADLALWTARCQDWPLAALAKPGFHMFRVGQHEGERPGCTCVPLDQTPAIAGDNVYHVQVVSSRVAPSPPSRRRAARKPCFYYTAYCTVKNAKALSPPENGLDLRKLVAGAGFEPATSGL